MTAYTTSHAPRSITPVTLHNSDAGSWLRTWSNGAEVLVRNERTGRLDNNPARLSANIHRSDDKKSWTIRLFVMGERVVNDGVWTLRMVRQLLAYLAADWKPQGTDAWFLRQQAQEAMHKAWLEAADAEIERM